MNKNYFISVNQFAEFSKGTDCSKRRIIRNQKSPNKFRVAWYQFTRAKIKKSLANNCDLDYIIKGIEELTLRIPKKQRQIANKNVSLEALHRYVKIKLPDLLGSVSYEIIKTVKIKSVFINGVEIIISPDIIFKIESNGKTYLGAVKIHISKNNIFDDIQSRYISSLLNKYLKENVAKGSDEVLQELCLSIDVFGEKVVSVPKNLFKSLKEIDVICEEIKSLWNVA